MDMIRRKYLPNRVFSEYLPAFAPTGMPLLGNNKISKSKNEFEILTSSFTEPATAGR
jgi:hypothetical protein